jgi:hypothetical protein
MLLFETNPEVVLNMIDDTILILVVKFPSMVLGATAGLVITYLVYKAVREAIIMSWCKTLIPAGIMVHALLLLRLVKSTMSVLSQLWKMI